MPNTVAPIIGAVGSALGWAGANATALATGVGAAGSIYAASKAGKVPSAPKPIPMPDDQALEATRRRRLIGEMQRGGRASTILGGSGDRRDTLG